MYPRLFAEDPVASWLSVQLVLNGCHLNHLDHLLLNQRSFGSQIITLVIVDQVLTDLLQLLQRGVQDRVNARRLILEDRVTSCQFQFIRRDFTG